MIRIENLRKEYDAKTVALDGIDLVFEDSTFVALLALPAAARRRRSTALPACWSRLPAKSFSAIRM